MSFRLERGLIARKLEVPGMIGQVWGGTPAAPIVTARIDPPLSDGAQFVFEAWRPLDVEGPRPDGGTTEPTRAGGPGRTCPRIEPVGFEQHNGLLGVRRPGDWTGRLGSDAGANPLGDESFVKAWGALPDDRLTLAGTTRLDFKRLPTLRTGPAAPRARIKPTTHLRIDPGRIDFLFEAEIGEVSGSLDHLKVELPRELTILSVESDGLTDWSLAEDRGLLLRYDRPSPGVETEAEDLGLDPRARGSAPIRRPGPASAHALASGGRPRLFAGPADRHIGREGRDHSILKGSRRSRRGPHRWRAWGIPVQHQMFLVDDSAKLGELRWIPPGPRVNVLIESQLTIHPDLAEWVAVVQYEVAGGALDSIHLKVPTAWAARAQVERGDDG